MIIEKYLLRDKYKKKNSLVKTINFEKDLKLGKYVNISKRVVLSNNVQIDDFTYLNANKYWITIESNTKIGKFCSIAPGVHIGAGNHDYKFVTTHPILFDSYYEKRFQRENIQKHHGLKDKDKETIIGNDVWIGLNAIIKRGITIGDGAVIAAGSVVCKDVPSYAIVGGNPAKIIKYRTTEANIDIINNNKDKMWWNWPVEKIFDDIENLYDIDSYISIFKK